VPWRRAETSGWGPLESLPEVVEAVNGTVPVIIDSGCRRGTDIFKALAMGASTIADIGPQHVGLRRPSEVG